MNTGLTEQDLIDFEERIAKLFYDKKIKCPIHLSGGNELKLFNIFKSIHEDDYVLSTHRNHLHALMKGINKDWLEQQILNGDSMHIYSKEHVKTKHLLTFLYH